MSTDSDRIVQLEKEVEAEKSRQLKLKEIEANKQRLRELEEKKDDIRRDTFMLEKEMQAKDKARRAYLMEGGSSAEFEVEWPAIRREARRYAAVAALAPEGSRKGRLTL